MGDHDFQSRSGHVYLVGAGPGDPELLTLKGQRALAAADVVVYDRLIHPALLDLAPAQAERIYAGKRPDRHTLTQDEINGLLIERGLAGQTVVRLKGGDPFVFGRGGEEAEALRAAGVRFDVVPGVTSAIAVPAYAGIPVTHRDECSAFAVITGHEEPGGEGSTLDYDALARVGTLVFLMGVGRLAAIAERLIRAGMNPGTPAAVVMWGTYPQQKSVTATLATIYEAARAAGIGAPSVIIVGNVVNQREVTTWFDDPAYRPLFGRRVLVPRTRAHASILANALRTLGAETVEFPAVQVAPPAGNYEAIDGAIAALTGDTSGESPHDWVVFSSVEAVGIFWARLRAGGKDARSLYRTRIAALGHATVTALAAHGIVADVAPDGFSARALLAAIPDARGKRFLLLAGGMGREPLREGLEAAGVVIDQVEGYRAVLSRPAGEEARALEQGVHVVAFTSSNTVRNFVQHLGTAAALRLATDALVAAIGPATAQTAREHGLPVHLEPADHTIQGLVEAIVGALAPRTVAPSRR